MKKSILKNNLREIVKTRRRFLSILVMAFLGVGFFAGLRACGPDMATALDRYADNNNLYDISIISTLGLTNDDINEIKKIDGVKNVYGIKSINSLANIDEEEKICKVIEYSEDVNIPYLVEGRLPENNDECLIDDGYIRLNKGEKIVGKKLKLNYDEKNDDDQDNILVKEYTIVGLVESPDYISFERGNAPIGNGKVDYFIYVNRDVFNFDYYVNIYSEVEGAEELDTTTDKYNDTVNDVYKKIEKIKGECEDRRYNSLVNDANSKLNDAQKELDDKKKEADEKIGDAQKKIDDAKKEINKSELKLKNAEIELANQRVDIAQKFQDAQNKISSYEAEISNKKGELENGQRELDQKKAEVSGIINQIDEKKLEIDNALKGLNDNKKLLETGVASLSQIEQGLKELNNNLIGLNSQKEILENTINTINTNLNETPEEEIETIANLNNSLNETQNMLNNVIQNIDVVNGKISELTNQKDSINNSSSALTEINKNIEMLESKKQEIEVQKSQITSGINDAQLQIDQGRAQLASAEAEINNQKNVLNENIKKADKEFSDAEKKIADGKKELNDGKQELAENETKFNNEKNDANQKIMDAQNKLDKAKDDVSKIEKAKWYITERKKNSGYSNIKDAIKTMANIAQSFPAIFYAIAVLVSLTSMTRMIEEERTEIGTLKALGYTNIQIISKFVLYIVAACTIGGAIGMFVGLTLLPSMVWSMYKTIYTIPYFQIIMRYDLGLYGLVLEIICILLATIYVSSQALKEVPASLMRPKAPKNGKKILLERIKFVWNRLNFSQKVIIRNISRYKKRAMITIIGIAGCTALMVTGFGIRDSIRDITGAQYKNEDAIFTYNIAITLSNTNSLNEIEDYLKNEKRIESFSEIMATTSKVVGNDKEYDATIFAVENLDDFNKECHLTKPESKEKLEIPNNGVIITMKLASFLGVSVGDEINVIDSDDISHTFVVSGIAENYVTHYIYMTKDYYENNIKTYKTNMILISLNSNDIKDKEKVSEDILNLENISSLQDISSQIVAVDDMLNTVDMIVVIMVVSSALLDFVVLYNLANINIGERIREIATLKVLGFYDKEVDDYVNKENIIYTIIGILCGLFLGYFLTNMIIKSVEVDSIRFIRHILKISYVYSALCTFVFSIIVNFIIHFILKKIDMIDSLKSVE